MWSRLKSKQSIKNKDHNTLFIKQLTETTMDTLVKQSERNKLKEIWKTMFNTTSKGSPYPSAPVRVRSSYTKYL